jgi:hypothetical protein
VELKAVYSLEALQITCGSDLQRSQKRNIIGTDRVLVSAAGWEYFASAPIPHTLSFRISSYPVPQRYPRRRPESFKNFKNAKASLQSA